MSLPASRREASLGALPSFFVIPRSPAPASLPRSFKRLGGSCSPHQVQNFWSAPAGFSHFGQFRLMADPLPEMGRQTALYENFA
jgi:hypothetical protein